MRSRREAGVAEWMHTFPFRAAPEGGVAVGETIKDGPAEVVEVDCAGSMRRSSPSQAAVATAMAIAPRTDIEANGTRRTAC